MRWLASLLIGFMLWAVPTALRAQEQVCELLPGAREANRVATGDGRQMIFISGPAVFSCPGGTSVKADSAIGVPGSGELELIGRVFYEDSLKTLAAEWLRYVRDDGRLYARENVVLTDKETGSTVEGSELEYYRAGPDRPEALGIVRGRPHAVIYEKKPTEAPLADSASIPADTVDAPVEIDSDRMELIGEDFFRAFGNVEIRRVESRGFGSEAEFDQAAGRMLLIGDARVEGDEFTLVGDRIEAWLENEKLREVHAVRDAILVGEDLRVDAPDLKISFEDGKVHRMIAVRDSATEMTDRPIAAARDFRLIADSIDAIAPGQELERVIAVGEAYAEQTVDSLGTDLPDVIARDWLRGDTITGYFVREPVPVEERDPVEMAGDSVETRSVLDRLVAVGPEGRARSLYRVREEKDRSEPSVNYLVANRIILIMSNGEVKDVEAEGPIQGMHLQPKGKNKGEEDRPEGGGSDQNPQSQER